MPGRFARRVADDLSPGRIGGRRGHARELHGAGVGKAGVPRRVSQQHGVVRRHRGQRIVRLKTAHRRIGRRVPLALVPTAADDPVARLRGSHGLGYHVDQVLVRSGGHEVELQARVAQAHQVTVPLDEPGNREPAGQVDDVRLGGRCRRRRQRRSPRTGCGLPESPRPPLPAGRGRPSPRVRPAGRGLRVPAHRLAGRQANAGRTSVAAAARDRNEVRRMPRKECRCNDIGSRSTR